MSGHPMSGRAAGLCWAGLVQGSLWMAVGLVVWLVATTTTPLIYLHTAGCGKPGGGAKPCVYTAASCMCVHCTKMRIDGGKIHRFIPRGVCPRALPPFASVSSFSFFFSPCVIRKKNTVFLSSLNFFSQHIAKGLYV